LIEVSIIVPTLNSSPYIIKTLESIVNQDFKDFEIIVIDGNSTDDTIKIVRKFLKEKQTIEKIFNYKVICEKKKGIGHARNIGLKHSKGKYVFFLDSDDIMDQFCLSKLYYKVVKSDSDITFCGFDELDEDSNIINNYENKYRFYDTLKNGKEVLLDRLRGKIWIWTGSAIYNKRIIDQFKIRYSEDFNYGEDHEFICKTLFHSERVNSLNETLVYYIIRSNSVTNTINLKEFESIRAWHSLLNYLKSNSSKGDTKILEYIEFVHIPKSILVTISHLLDKNIDVAIINQKMIEDNLYEVLHKSKILEFSINNIKTFFETRLLCFSFNLFLIYLKYKKYYLRR